VGLRGFSIVVSIIWDY